MNDEPGTLEPDLAATALSDIARMEQRTREAISYANGANNMLWWGALSGIAYTVEQFAPRTAQLLWPATMVVGVVGTAVILLAGRRWSREQEGRANLRVIWGMLALIAFGALWTVLLYPEPSRLYDLFWPTLFMLGIGLLGIWLGRFLIWTGLAVTVLAVAGYHWAGDWFDLWMAVVDGAGLILSGLWLRRLRVSR